VGQIILGSHLGSGVEHAGDFLEYALALGGVLASDGGGHAGVEVILQDGGAHLVEGGLDRLDLADHIDAVSVFFEHADDAVQMAFGILQTFDDEVGLVHMPLLPPPGGWGQTNHTITLQIVKALTLVGVRAIIRPLERPNIAGWSSGSSLGS
jgi:hypothetical protein